MSQALTDLELARMRGVSITQIRRERDEAKKRLADPAMRAFRTTLRKAMGLKP